jgi:hypothetical protein
MFLKDLKTLNFGQVGTKGICLKIGISYICEQYGAGASFALEEPITGKRILDPS